MDELTHDDAGVDAGDETDLTGPTTDLTPRAVPAARRRRRRTPWAAIALVLVVAALLVVVFNGLGDATLFFRNADEAVAQRDSLGDRRFRIQGRVDGDSITPTATGVDFVIRHGDAEVTVVHEGDPPDLFQENIPVVLEGRWARVGDPEVAAPAQGLTTDDGWYFASDRFFVKHEEVYVAENPERTDDYTDGQGDDGETEGRSTP